MEKGTGCCSVNNSNILSNKEKKRNILVFVMTIIVIFNALIGKFDITMVMLTSVVTIFVVMDLGRKANKFFQSSFYVINGCVIGYAFFNMFKTALN